MSTPTTTELLAAGAGVVAVAAIIAVLGLADRIDQAGDEAATYQAWLRDACLPRPGETAVARNRDGKISCTRYSRIERGMTPVIVSAAVSRVPQ